jgi:erythronate-4-phosphate dehydrogenase
MDQIAESFLLLALMNIIADATLPNLIELFPRPFKISTYSSHEVLHKMLPFHDALICRSTLQVDATLLANSQIQCVATASSGIDHIDTSYLNLHDIKLFDAKGSNANAVADYVTSTLAWLEQRQLLTGHKAGVIGVGEVGSQVIERLHLAGYHVFCFDPYKDPASKPINNAKFQALLDCDVLCIHANLHQEMPWPSLNLINADVMSKLKAGVTIINASRGGIVNETDLLTTKTKIQYCTDVYCGEPNINPDIVDFATLCTPHIAGHSIEAKLKAMTLLSSQLHRHFGIQKIDIHPSDTKKSEVNLKKPWHTEVLHRYNPYDDTARLKHSGHKRETFLTLRKAHTFRHDFSCL